MEHYHGGPELIALLQCQDDGLLVFGWHDRRGQQGCVLGQMCLYAPWRLSGMINEVSTVAYWIGCVDMHQSKNMN